MFNVFNNVNRLGWNHLTWGLLDDPIPYAIDRRDKEVEELEKLCPDKDIIPVDFPDNRYFREQTKKKQIALHHTVSGRGVDGDIAWWIQNTARIATSKIIDWEGNIFEVFATEYWAHHLGVTQNFLMQRGFSDFRTRNLKLNKKAIGIEIDAWGPLVKHNRDWHPARWDGGKFVANTRVAPIKNVTKYGSGYRGFYGYEKYTDEQIESLRKLLVFSGEKHNIPLNYNEDMWDISDKALSGEPGIWSHTSYRLDKSDAHPQPELIDMLKSL